MDSEQATPYGFFYECCRCKTKIPASVPDNITPTTVKTIQKGNEYTFECADGCPPKE